MSYSAENTVFLLLSYFALVSPLFKSHLPGLSAFMSVAFHDSFLGVSHAAVSSQRLRFYCEITLGHGDTMYENYSINKDG